MTPCHFGCHEFPAARGLRYCLLCDRHLCENHMHALRKCPKRPDKETYAAVVDQVEKRELARFLADFKTEALKDHASHLRWDIPCSITPVKDALITHNSVIGGRDLTLIITFEDSEEWIARMHIPDSASSKARRMYVKKSEVATLKFLETTSIPAPKVVDFVPEDTKNNAVGAGFILLEKLQGKPVEWIFLEPGQRTKVTDQLADIYAELHSHVFLDMGCLDVPDEPHVGPFPGQVHLDEHGKLIYPPGVFRYFPNQYYYASRNMIPLRNRLHMAVGPEGHSPRDEDLIEKYLSRVEHKILSKSTIPDNSFYLKHANDGGDFILVDDNSNITGLVNWQGAHTAPAAVAFNSPAALMPMGAFYDGENELGKNEVSLVRALVKMGRHDLAEHIRKGRLQHRFTICREYDLAGDWDGAMALFRALRDLMGGEEAGLDWEEWKRLVQERRSGQSGDRAQRLVPGAGTEDKSMVI